MAFLLHDSLLALQVRRSSADHISENSVIHPLVLLSVSFHTSLAKEKSRLLSGAGRRSCFPSSIVEEQASPWGVIGSG